jgi:PII-like signaling protein
MTNAERLTIYLLQTRHHGRSADFVEIVSRARRAHLAGVTVLQGVAGFGASAMMHSRHAASVAEAVPLKVVMIESPERIDDFLGSIGELIGGALVIRQPVQVLRRGGDGSGR